MDEKRNWGDRGEWYVVVQFILFGIIFLLPFLGPQLQDWPAPWNSVGVVLGILLAGIGFLFSFTGLVNLGRNLTAVPRPLPNGHFVEKGFYRLVRHPIYCGIIIATFGWGFFMNNFLVLIMGIVLFLFFDIKTRREEQWLAEKYVEYADYQKRVHKLIPFVY